MTRGMPRSLRRAPLAALAALAAWAGVGAGACAGAGPPPAPPVPPAPVPAPAEPAWETYVPDRCRDGGLSARGCRPRRIVTTSSSIEILEPIAFVGNTAEVSPGSYRMMDAVARSLLDNPSILVLEVRGHSDSLLHPAERAELARKRAEVVAAYLVAQGVDPSRVTTYGASDSELLYPADDPRNRRVDFLIVARDE
jgi:outer membrane protein OmpA-like peptidoglycan-associated protein